jgi:hypothetical protein
MYLVASRRITLRAVLLTAVVLALATACGREERQVSTPRPLPEEEQQLRPGLYRSEEFEPSLTFTVGEGWSMAPPETSDHLHLQRGVVGGLGFLKIAEIYEPARNGMPTLAEVPEDWVAWYRRHPYLRTSNHKQVEVGGVEGEQFDTVVADLPEGYRGICGTGCVDLVRVEGIPSLALYEDDKARVVVLEDVEGETVTIPFNSPATDFDEGAREAQEVIDTVEWRGE